MSVEEAINQIDELIEKLSGPYGEEPEVDYLRSIKNEILKSEPECKTCNDTGKLVRTFTGSIGLETNWRPKGSCTSREDEEKDCPDCEKPEAGVFTDEYLIEWLRSDAIPRALQDGCNRAAGIIDHQANDIDQYRDMLKARKEEIDRLQAELKAKDEQIKVVTDYLQELVDVADQPEADHIQQAIDMFIEQALLEKENHEKQ